MRSIAIAVLCIISHARKAKQFGDVNEWELANVARYRAGELNDAELGVANLKMAIRDPSMMSEVAQWLRHQDGQTRFIQMMADPNFQHQAKQVAETLKETGNMPQFLTLEFYANMPLNDDDASVAKAIISQAREGNVAFHAPAGNSKRVRSSDTRMRNLGPFSLPTTRSAKKTTNAQKDARAAKRSSGGAGGLEELMQNPSPPEYWDPLNLATQEFWEQSNEATIGFLRHAEIKHGRVAMAGFIGYCIHENGIHFPWKYPGVDWAEFEKLSAPAVWDNLPVGARIQIIVAIGILEAYGENSVALEADGEAHYMRGGKPGYYPTFDSLYHPVPFNLYDPFKLFEEQTEEQKARRLFAEINNGRLAMIGLFSLLLASKSDQAVPILNGLIKKYDGDVMAPLSPGFSVADLGV
jgi:hypothetical protein